MIKIDLITGFLGSGKTTFIKKYAEFLTRKGIKVGILENDYGAVNVDMMLLEDALGESCGLEMVAGGCGQDCHARRYKTKLIAMAMCGYERIIVEPSGIFDVDEFFDALYDPPLDRWYQAGSVISIVDPMSESELTEISEYLMLSETACGGILVYSKAQLCLENEIEKKTSEINTIMGKYGCKRVFTEEKDILAKDWETLDEADFERIMNAGYFSANHIKKSIEGYSSLYYMNLEHSPDELAEKAKLILKSEDYGKIYRIKGFAKDENSLWYEINLTSTSFTKEKIKRGQPIVIVIGENPQKEKIDVVFGKAADGMG